MTNNLISQAYWCFLDLWEQGSHEYERIIPALLVANVSGVQHQCSRVGANKVKDMEKHFPIFEVLKFNTIHATQLYMKFLLGGSRKEVIELPNRVGWFLCAIYALEGHFTYK